MRAVAVTLWTARVFSDGGLIGSFPVAAPDAFEAKAVARAWAEERNYRVRNILIRKSQQPVFVKGE